MKDFVTVNWDGRINNYSYVGLNLKYVFSLAVFHPYLTAGYGYYTVDIHDIDKNNDGGYNLGAGLEIRLGRKFSILAEGKYHHVTVDIQKINLGLGNFTICGGINFYF